MEDNKSNLPPTPPLSHDDERIMMELMEMMTRISLVERKFMGVTLLVMIIKRLSYALFVDGTFWLTNMDYIRLMFGV